MFFPINNLANGDHTIFHPIPGSGRAFLRNTGSVALYVNQQFSVKYENYSFSNGPVGTPDITPPASTATGILLDVGESKELSFSTPIVVMSAVVGTAGQLNFVPLA